jgi:hypothetical protein
MVHQLLYRTRLATSIGLASLLVTLCLFSGALAQSTQPGAAPSENARRYEPDTAGNSIPLPGHLLLSSTSAQFEKLQGMMELAFAGRMSKSGSWETDGALVYKVLNAEAFSSQNEDRWLCRHEPIRWLTIRPGAYEIRLGWLTVADYRDYRPDSTGLCFAQTFDLSE